MDIRVIFSDQSINMGEGKYALMGLNFGKCFFPRGKKFLVNLSYTIVITCDESDQIPKDVPIKILLGDDLTIEGKIVITRESGPKEFPQVFLMNINHNNLNFSKSTQITIHAKASPYAEYIEVGKLQIGILSSEELKNRKPTYKVQFQPTKKATKKEAQPKRNSVGVETSKSKKIKPKTKAAKVVTKRKATF